MTKIDFKYTSLFIRLEFIEEQTDLFLKSYEDWTISIQAERQEINYGLNPDGSVSPTRLIAHEDFVILEAVVRLLSLGYSRQDLIIHSTRDSPSGIDITVLVESHIFCQIKCCQWGMDYTDQKEKFLSNLTAMKSKNEQKSPSYKLLYTSRMDGGLIEYEAIIVDLEDGKKDPSYFFTSTFFDNLGYNHISTNLPLDIHEQYLHSIDKQIIQSDDAVNFDVQDGILIKYKGSDNEVIVPEGIIRIGTGAFWDCNYIETILLPEGITAIGGDAFYYCKNLREVNIPSTVDIIGNDPFAGCPELTVTNNSPSFLQIDHALYDQAKTIIIHYDINSPVTEFAIPEGVNIIGKHAFYDCNNLRTIIIPSSVVSIENNVFAGCNQLEVTNNSPHFSVEDGILYNFEQTQLYSLIDHTKKELVLPETLRTIGKNSFFNRTNLEYLELSSNINRIGYNPFVGCLSMAIESKSEYFTVQGGILYDQHKELLVCCPNTSIQNGTVEFISTVKELGRNAFGFCHNLEFIELPTSITAIPRGLFSGCHNLKSVVIPDSVQSIGKWSFGHCSKLKTLVVPNGIYIEDYAFVGSPTEIITRGDND